MQIMMKNETREQQAIIWASMCLEDKGYSLQETFKLVRKRPWSIVYRILVNNTHFYLKQTACSLSTEVVLLPYIANYFQSLLPEIIGINVQLGCLLMSDAGISLRDRLCVDYQINIVNQALTAHALIQHGLLSHVETLIALGVPDWRLINIPSIYLNLLQNTDFLIADGLTQTEINDLNKYYPSVCDLCSKLAQIHIPETIEQGDCKDSNLLINHSNHLIISDWGETVITHPFFSLEFFLVHAVRDHFINRRIFNAVKNSYLKHWLIFESKERLEEAFILIQRLGGIKLALAAYRLRDCPGMERYKGLVAKPLKNFLCRAYET